MPEPLVTWQVPVSGQAETLRLEAVPGAVSTVLGPNGAGKSALGVWLRRMSREVATYRILAHRQLWLANAGPQVSPARAESQEQQLLQFGSDPRSRHEDQFSSQRPDLAIFRLVSKLIAQNRDELSMWRSGVEPPQTGDVLATLNRVMSAAQLPISIRLTDAQSFEVLRDGGHEYPITMLSDGEKSAFLLAAEVLTSPENCVFIIDEPERHLHRSISVALVRALLSERSDCHFVVMTHDVDLAHSLWDRGPTLLLSSVSWEGKNPSSWALIEAPIDATIPDEARVAILGGRREILFVEGAKESVDALLYQILYPGWTIHPVGGAHEVIRATTGLNDSDGYHWLHAAGVVDRDARSDEEAQLLKERGVMVLGVSEAENLYFTTDVVRAMALEQAETLRVEAETLAANCVDEALGCLSEEGTLARLSRGVAIARLRDRAMARLPTDLDSGAAEVTVTVDSPYPALLATAESLLADRKLDELLVMLPIRETALRTAISSRLGFQKAAHYEAAVRSRLRRDPELVRDVRARAVGELSRLAERV